MIRSSLLLVFLPACSGDDRQEACDTYIDSIGICYDDFCEGEGAETPFCGCWSAGQDIDPDTCECLALPDFDAVCQVVDVRGVDFDCAAAQEAVSGYCG